MNPKNKLAEMPIRLLLYTMAVPLMLSLLIQSLYNIVDSIFVARLSETALTAASLVYAIQFLMIAIGVGTAVGLNALLSRKLGQKKPEEACRAATTGLFLMLGTSLVFTLVGLLFSNQIAAALTGDSELQQLCREYLSVNLVFCWGIFLQTYGQRLLQAVGDTVLSMVSLIIGAVVNIILDPIMIFGLLGCPAMGIRGAAIATVIGQLIGAVAALWFNRVKNPVIHVQLKGYRFLWQDVADIYRVGLPTIVMQAIGSVMIVGGIAPFHIGVEAVVSRTALVLFLQTGFGRFLPLPIDPHDAVSTELHVRMDKDLQAVGAVLQDEVGAAPHNDAGLFFRQLSDEPVLQLPEQVLVGGAKAAVGEGRGKEAAGGVLSGFLDVVFVKAAFGSQFLDQFSVVALDAQMLCRQLADGSAAAAKFPADGDDALFH